MTNKKVGTASRRRSKTISNCVRECASRAGAESKQDESDESVMTEQKIFFLLSDDFDRSSCTVLFFRGSLPFIRRERV